MPGWLEVLVGALGTGALTGLIVGLVIPTIQRLTWRRRARAQQPDHAPAHAHAQPRARAQPRAHAQQRERGQQWEQGEAEAHAAWVARQRERCAALLDAVSRWNRLLLTFRSLHDLPASRVALQDQLEPQLHQLPLLDATVRSFWRELEGEAHAHVRAAVERFDLAALAYQEALLGRWSAQWHNVERQIGTAPQEEVRRRAAAYDARRRELELAVEGYVASLEASASPYPAPARRQHG